MLYAWTEPKFCPQCGTRLIAKVPEGDHRERTVCPGCAYIYYVGPKVAAGTVPVRDGRTYLVRRGVEPGRGLWSFPCGYMELDETLSGAAARETREETGLDVRILSMLGIYTYPAPDQHIRVVVAAYLAEVVAGVPAASDDVVEVQAFRPEEIPWTGLAFHSSHAALRQWIALQHPAYVPPPHRFPGDY